MQSRGDECRALPDQPSAQEIAAAAFVASTVKFLKFTELIRPASWAQSKTWSSPFRHRPYTHLGSADPTIDVLVVPLQCVAATSRVDCSLQRPMGNPLTGILHPVKRFNQVPKAELAVLNVKESPVTDIGGYASSQGSRVGALIIECTSLISNRFFVTANGPGPVFRWSLCSTRTCELSALPAVYRRWW